ncbi:MAG: hypothetical protein ACTSVI_08360 [Promethearchaeota archaeon]
MKGQEETVEYLLEEELENDIKMKDYQIDRIKRFSSLYFKERSWEKDVEFTKKAMNYFLIGLSIFSFSVLVLFCYIYLNLYPFLLFYIVVQATLIIWRFFFSPVRYNAFRDMKTFITYRGYLTQGPRLRTQLRDDKYKFLVFIYLFLNMLVLCSIIDAPRLVPYLNNIIYNRGENPGALLSSLVPAVIVLGFIINIFGAIVGARYKVVEKPSGRVKPSKVMSLVFITVIVSIFILIFAAIDHPSDMAQFLKPSATNNNWIYYFDQDQPITRSRNAVFTFYGLVYFGATGLAILVILGLTAFETALLHAGQNKHVQHTGSLENNWEYKAARGRQEKMRLDKIKTRKRSLLEIAIMCLSMIIGMWLFLYYGGEVAKIKWMSYAGYAVIGLALIWFMVLSPFYHAKKDGKYHYPTMKHNAFYAWFDERGMGSFKYYYREVFSKKRSLLLWTTYWLLMLAAVFNFDEINLGFMNWQYLFQNPTGTPSGVIVDFVGLLVDAPNESAVSVILFATGLSVIAFIAALDKKKEQFGGSLFWCIFYKVIIGVVLLGCFFWLAKVPNIIEKVDFTSGVFIQSLIMTIIFFGITTVALIFFVIPFVVKFDNLNRGIAKDIVLILISTIVLTWIIIVIFDFFLPMTDINGLPVVYGYPFKTGEEYEVSNLVANFDLGVFLMEWFGRYIAWGAVQQYLFMSYFLTLWKKVFPRSKGYIVAVLTASIFGVVHAIDWPLMIFTAVAGMIWAWYWNQEYFDKKTGRVMKGNNLLLWGIVHGFGGSLLGILMPFTLGVGPFNM